MFIKQIYPKKTSNRVWYILLVGAVIAALWVVALKSDAFVVKTVSIEGLNNVTESEARLLCGLSGSVNVLEFSPGKAEKALLGSPYIKGATVTRKLPGTINITIDERRPCGYIDHRQSGTYILIDETGTAIEAAAYTRLKLPLIEGLNIEAFTIGEPVGGGNGAGMEAAFEIARILPSYDLDVSVTRIDVSDPDRAHVYIGAIDADFGAGADLPRKVRDLKSVLESGRVNESAKCYMDLTGEAGTVTYRYTK